MRDLADAFAMLAISVIVMGKRTKRKRMFYLSKQIEKCRKKNNNQNQKQTQNKTALDTTCIHAVVLVRFHRKSKMVAFASISIVNEFCVAKFSSIDNATATQNKLRSQVRVLHTL